MTGNTTVERIIVAFVRACAHKRPHPRQWTDPLSGPLLGNTPLHGVAHGVPVSLVNQRLFETPRGIPLADRELHDALGVLASGADVALSLRTRKEAGKRAGT